MTALQERYPDEEMGSHRPAGMFERKYARGREMQVQKPEEYAIKNWIIKVQFV